MPTNRKLKITMNGALFGNLPWGVILIAIGIGLYFSLNFEPSGKIIALLLVIIALLWSTNANRKIIGTVLSALLVICLGYSAALYRTHSTKTPLLPEKLKFHEIQMMVEEAIPLQHNRIRYIGQPQKISRIPSVRLPKRIRLRTGDQGPRFQYGDIICGKVMISAPKGPLLPGGYDFGQALWFNKIGGTGFTMSALRTCKDKSNQTATTQNVSLSNNAAANLPVRQSTIAELIANLRRAIGERLDIHLKEPHRAIARALILGDRGRIEQKDLEALRKAGLGHLLAISGLHMAVFAGTLFFISRAGMALFPKLTEEYPIKKWAAIIALVGGGGYFLISGQSIPTQRAFLMISVLFLAMLVERPALTLRNVGLAALVILIFRPESLLSPGFQMSFAAVTALIVTYQINLSYQPLQQFKQNTMQSPKGRWLKPFYYLIGIWITSLVATLATAPFAIFHFHQVSYMGPLGNMLAIPIFSILLMPCAVAALTLMPFGMEQIALVPLSFAIDLLLTSAHWTASFDPAILKIGTITATSVIIITAAALLLFFSQSKLRWLSIPIAVAAIMTAKPSIKPALYVNDNGTLVVIRGEDNLLHAGDGRKASFTLENWLKADGDGRTPSEVRNSKEFICDDSACAGQVKGQKIVFVKNLAALREECQSADILIYQRSITTTCNGPRLTLTNADFAKGGAHAIYIEDGIITVKRANSFRSNRIWSGNKQ